jgi:class 3 adenylate cyclase/tetratricopeptide (TPR) repeat protein
MVRLVETLTSYVPRLLTRRLETDPAPISEPSVTRFPAAVLFADISGFTALAERLGEGGPAGAEQLTTILNTYFGQLIDLITIHGGDVVKFAGDGLLAVWPAGDEDLPTVTRRAAQCGLVVQATLHNYPAAAGVRLALRVGIGAGPVFAVQIGGVYGRWELMIAGQPLTEMSTAERRAQPGEVLLAPAAWSLIDGSAIGQPAGGPRLAATLPGEPAPAMRLDTMRVPLPLRGMPAMAVPAGAEQALRPFIPGAIITRLAAGQTGWLAELRRVTVIFLNLPDMNHSVPQALDQGQAIMQALQTALYRYEGSINKLNVDDKGVTLVAALGLPPLAHEDDAARGVLAALAMQDRLRDLGVRCAIGVATGRAFCGEVGNATRREYTMVGGVVNLAARLMQAAPGDILCDAPTYQAAQVLVTFDALPPVIVKGRAEPVPVYRPHGEAPLVVRPPTAIVGRVAEQAVLTDQLQGLLRRRQGGVVVIEGEAGIGKSRLVEELGRQATTLGVRVLLGAGDAIERATSYHAWRPIFQQVFQLDTLPDDGDMRRAQVRTHLGTDSRQARLAPLLNAVLPLDLPDTELTAQMSGQVRADNTRELLLGLLRAAVRRQPTVLILEDAHWLDSASWALALAASRQIHPLLLVVATRPLGEPLPTEYRQLLEAGDLHRLRLEGLSPQDTITLIGQRLGVTRLPDPVVALIRERAEGHPFFSEELAFALRDSGLIQISGGVCRVAPDAGDLRALDFPDTVQGVITSRIDRLTAQQQLTLKVASVIGRVFAYRILRDIHPIEADRARLADDLSTLARLDLTPLDVPPPELSYIFKHIITREVAYNLMLFAQRRELHRATAAWYEQAYSEDLAPFYALLAHHWSKAEVTDKALEYLEKAGAQALRTGAYQEAGGFFTQALQVGRHEPDSLRRSRWERQLGEAYWGLGNLRAARPHLETALALLGERVPTARGQWLRALLGQVRQQLVHRLRYSGPGAALRRPAGPAQAPRLEAAQAYETLGTIFYLTSEKIPSIYTCVAGLNVAEPGGRSAELARSYARMGTALGFIPIHRLAVAYGRRARQTVRLVDDLPAEGYVAAVTGLYAMGVGQWGTAQANLRHAVALADRLGDRRHWEEYSALLQWVTYRQGDYARAASIATHLYQVGRRTNHTQAEMWGLIGQILNALRLGQLEKTEPWVDALNDLLARDTWTAENVRAHAALALNYWARGEPDLARQAAAQTAHILSQVSLNRAPNLDAVLAVGEIALVRWEAAAPVRPPEQAAFAHELRQASAALRAFTRVFPIGQPYLAYQEGRAAWLLGRPRDAARAWRTALVAARRLAMPYEQGLIHYEIARHRPPGDPARAAHLARAAALFRRLGAAPDLARVESARHS